jgi:hypothetical protein
MRNYNIRVIVLCVAILLFPISFVLAQDNEAGTSNEAEQIYKEWVETYKGIKVDPLNPLYLKLLKLPEGDLFFLKGLHHTKDPIRRLSRRALAQLKTDRSFDAFVLGLRDKNMFVREKCLYVLGDFRQPRCIPIILKMLSKDPEPQIRHNAAYLLRKYKGDKVEAALLKALRDNEWVAVTAAQSLGFIGSEKAIEPNYELVQKVERDSMRENAIGGLCVNKNKLAVDFLVKLLQRFSERSDSWGKRYVLLIETHLIRYYNITSKTIYPVPDTVEQWQDWWLKAKPLFAKNMKLKAKEKRKSEFKSEDFGKDPADLSLTTSVDSREYRMGDPIRLNISMRNRSGKPYSIIRPRLPSGWWPTMAYGIQLKRFEKHPEVIINIAPSGSYQGSYGGPPRFENLEPGREFQDSICLQYFLHGQKVWPLSDGSYKLTIFFDPSKFPQIKPKETEFIHKWTAPTIVFEIKGKPRSDPKELLRIIGEKTGLKWLKTDLTSRRADRRKIAWTAVYEYGDSRLTPLIDEIINERSGKRENLLPMNCIGRNLREFTFPVKRENSSGE